MADISFPTLPAFPNPLIANYNEGLIENWLENENSGARIRRRVRSKLFSLFTFNVMCSDAQKTFMDTFIQETSCGGTKRFNWVRPYDGLTFVCQFQGMPRAIRNRSQGDAAKRWTFEFVLEQVE